MKAPAHGALAFLTSVCLSACVFLLCYHYDNKYTESAPVGADGVLTLDSAALEEMPAFHLVYGWEFYNGLLLSPLDFRLEQEPSGEEIFIGQYPGFEAGDPARSPHGSASYRLRIVIPPDARSYALELPEIYSAYRLFINGELLEQFGDPDPRSYRPLTGNSVVSFRASDSIEILFAVTDRSGFYSGLTYPPAFGTAHAVSGLLNERFAIRVAVCTVALAIGLFYLAAGALSRRNRLGILYALMCFAFVGSVLYPVLKTLRAGGPAWYGFERFCHCALLLLVVLIADRIARPARSPVLSVLWDSPMLSRAVAVFGAFVSAVAALSPFLLGDSLARMVFYSGLMDVYAWTVAAFLTLMSAAGVARGRIHSETLLCGVAVFDCSLVMDRLLPMFEPIRIGWFAEIAGAALAICFGVALTQETVRQSRERLLLEGRIDSISRLVDIQRAYYPVILEGIREAKAARHDLRHHMRLIREFAATGDLSALSGYLQDYRADSAPDKARSYTPNYAADMLLRHFAALAEATGVRFDAKADLPEQTNIPDADLVDLLGNLLENALEACARLPAGDRFASVSIRLWKGQLALVVRNSFDGALLEDAGRFLSRKRKGREGVGLASVRSAAERLGGAAEFRAERLAGEGDVFRAEVVVRATEETERTEGADARRDL